MESIATIIFIESSRQVGNEYSKKNDVNGNKEMLGDYVLRVTNEAGISLNEVERRAGRKGYKITQSYLSKIISGAAQNVTVEKLKALAVGLNRPEDEVFAVARGQNLDASKLNDAIMSSMAFGYGKLTKKDKEAIAPLLRALQREIDERLEKAQE